MRLALVAIGVVTMYAGSYVGGPLYCGGVYDTTHDWIAIDFAHMPGWRCGDEIAVHSRAGSIVLKALDSGPFGCFCAMDKDECVPIVGDLPGHVYEQLFGPNPTGNGSARVRLVNLSLARRELERIAPQ